MGVTIDHRVGLGPLKYGTRLITPNESLCGISSLHRDNYLSSMSNAFTTSNSLSNATGSSLMETHGK